METAGIILLLLLGGGVGIALALYLLKKPGEEGDHATTHPPGVFASLEAGLRTALGRLGESAWEELADVLLAADVGVETTQRIVRTVRGRSPRSQEETLEVLREVILGEFLGTPRMLELAHSPAVILVVGVNGTGKTTTIAKLGHMLMAEGRSVILGAADTFRAGAGDQLRAWADRLATRVVVGEEGADPASVAYDAVAAARANGVNAVIIDTAGRLHSKRNLMEELSKIHRVTGGDSSVDEVLLVLDATTGQNGIAQVREFASAVPVTGLVLTKLDGTARGGIVIAVEREMGVPVKYVGVGEGINDLVAFDPREFVDALLWAT